MIKNLYMLIATTLCLFSVSVFAAGEAAVAL